MDALTKARFLSDAGKHDSCGPKSCGVDLQPTLSGLVHAKSEHPNCRMFKTLMSNTCIHDCAYCVHRAGCTQKKMAYTPDELAKVFLYMYKQFDVNSLFLSSGVTKDADSAFEPMLEAIRLLREKYFFHGYIHTKVLPGTSKDLIVQAAKYSSRMSINIEAPNEHAINELSSTKSFKSDILRRQAWIKQQNLSGGQSTQLIVNNISTDRDILQMMDWQYKKMQLRRVYFSAFEPVHQTPLAYEAPTPKWRETRLYNIDFLLRDYQFTKQEIMSIMDDGMLPKTDPKVALARSFFDGVVDIKQASYEELIRVPGIGPVTAKRVQETKSIHSFQQLSKLGVQLNRAAPFIALNGSRQKTLFSFS